MSYSLIIDLFYYYIPHNMKVIKFKHLDFLYFNRRQFVDAKVQCTTVGA